MNLECVLKDDPEGEDTAKAWRFRGRTAYAEALTAGGIEMVSVANNHTVDYGEAGYASTLSALEGRVMICGNGRNTGSRNGRDAYPCRGRRTGGGSATD